jgi:hypothetical protein
VVVGAELYGITAMTVGRARGSPTWDTLPLASDVHHRTAPWVELAYDEPGLALFADELVTSSG